MSVTEGQSAGGGASWNRSASKSGNITFCVLG